MAPSPVGPGVWGLLLECESECVVKGFVSVGTVGSSAYIWDFSLLQEVLLLSKHSGLQRFYSV